MGLLSFCLESVLYLQYLNICEGTLSRSYKKPIIKDGYKSKWKRKEKRFANSTVRNSEFVDDFGYYKKLSDSWDICDWICDLRFSKDTKWKTKATRK